MLQSLISWFRGAQPRRVRTINLDNLLPAEPRYVVRHSGRQKTVLNSDSHNLRELRDLLAKSGASIRVEG